MSILLQRLLPKSAWLLVAIDGSNRYVDTIPYDGDILRPEAEKFISGHEVLGREVRCLVGRPRSILIRRPDLDDIRDVSGVCIRVPLSAKAAIEHLKTPPAVSFPFKGSYIVVWRFEEPASVSAAGKIEQMFARHFGGERLNFFVPIVAKMPYDIFINPKKPEEALEEREAERNTALMATVAPRARTWAIEPIVCCGKVTQIAGEPGMGKSQIAIDLSARLTRGEGLPGEPGPKSAAAVQIRELEDDIEEDIIPRLIVAKANRSLIECDGFVDLSTKAGVAKLAASIERFEERVRRRCLMLVLSPFLSFFGGGSNQEHHVRAKLVHIESFARETGRAVLAIGHLGDNGDVAGPKTYKRASRGSWNVIIDPTDPEQDEKKRRRLLVAGKVNNTDDTFRLGYRIKGDVLKPSGIKTSHIEWEDAIPFEVAANSALEAPVRKHSATTLKYVSALQDIFTPGGQPIKGVEVRRALTNGSTLTWGRPVYDAAEALGIDIGGRNGITESKPWTPPSQWPKAFS